MRARRRPHGGRRKATVTIGVFDGLHRGHLAILRRTLRRAALRRTRAAVVTFDRHPLSLLAPRLAPRCLQTLSQRIAGFGRLGFSQIFVMRFQKRLAALEPEEFIRRVLIRRLAPAELVVGYDFHFGRKGRGDARLLLRLGGGMGFRVTVVPPVLDRGEPISSTRIRRLVSMGKIAEAGRLLGHPYRLTGRRVRGHRRGRELGFPTINLAPDNELLPPRGVYAVRFPGADGAGVANLGTGPTFPQDGGSLRLEIHLLGKRPTAPLPGEIEVSLEKFLRPERRFGGPLSLKRQISRDVVAARRWFGK